jgi:hypothetical protein
MSTLTTHEPAQATLDHVNKLMVDATWAGGYAMGLVCALAWAEGTEPPLKALDGLSKLTMELPADAAAVALRAARVLASG